MAKRFIDTGFFKDPFVRGLQGAYKGLYVYLFLDCSNAGIWNVELDVAKLRCGIDDSVSDDDIKKVFKDKIIELDGGQKWFVVNYIKVQHNGLLKRNNKAHTAAIEELLKFELIDEVEEGEFQLSDKIIKGLPRGLQDPKVKVKVKEEGKGKGESNGKGNGELEKSKKFTTSDFPKVLIDLGADETQVRDWMKARKNKKAVNSETALRKFLKECENHEFPVPKAVEVCAENSWSGFKYEWVENLNNNQNGNRSNTNTRTDAQLRAESSDAVDQLLGKQ